VEAAVPVLVVATPPPRDVVVETPKIEVPEIDCGLAEAVAAKTAGVITLVYALYAGSSDSVVTGDGNAVNAFPAVLDRASVPGSPDGNARGL
jgi:hypothetical protein